MKRLVMCALSALLAAGCGGAQKDGADAGDKATMDDGATAKAKAAGAATGADAAKAAKAAEDAAKPPPVMGPALDLVKRCESRIAGTRTLRDEIVGLDSGGRTPEAILGRYRKIRTHLANAEAESSLWRSVHPNADMRKAAEWCEQQTAALATELQLDRGLFDAFDGLNVDAEPALTQRLVRKTLEDFKRAGVDKDEATRARIRKLSDEMVKVGQAFSKTIIQDRREIRVDPKALDGLPEDYVTAHKPGKDGKVAISTDYPDYIPFMTYSNDDAARRELYVTYRNRGWPKNKAHLQRLLEIRKELATLLGYDNWAALITSDKMMGSDEKAAAFLERITKIADRRMKAERKILLDELKKTDPKATAVQDWQKTWLTNRIKKQRFDFDAQAMRPYFHYDRVRDGLLATTAKLFGLRYEPRGDVKVWHEDVDTYDVYAIAEGDRPERKLGRIHLDMHPRDHKYKHAAQFTLTNGLKGVQEPVGVLVCNFPNPRTSNGLMEFQQVETFFHEFGHLMHHVLGGADAQWMRFSGVATEWDFVEAPSQIFEEWAVDYETLKPFAKNKRGQVVPKKLVEKMKAAEDFGRGLWVRHQMFYAAVSLNLHRLDPATLAGGDGHDAVVKDAMTKHSPYPFVGGTHMQTSFGHLNGYSAIYYTYMWSLVIAKDMFSRFEKEGVLNPKTARDYRDKILRPGGNKDAADLVADFLGRPFSFKSFEKWLDRGP
jgi:thimet oligopeptidase